MEFQFKTQEKYIEAWEYLMRVLEPFACDPDNLVIEIRRVDEQYDYEIVSRIQKIKNSEPVVKASSDDLRAETIKDNKTENVARPIHF